MSPFILTIAPYESIIRLFGTAKGDSLRTLATDREGWRLPVIEFAFAPHGGSIAFSTGFAPAVWKLTDDRVREVSVKSADPIATIAFAPDEQSLATCDRGDTIRIQDAATLAIRSIRRPSLGPDVRVITYSPDGQLLATGDASGMLRLHDIATGETIIEMKEHSGSVEFLRFSPDGAHLAAASPVDGRVVVWHSTRPVRQNGLGHDGFGFTLDREHQFLARNHPFH
jgi:WD40 repeat protein